MILINAISLVFAFVFLPVSAYATCENNESWSTLIDGVERYCKWIRFKEFRRQEYCLDYKVRRNCPQACGICCEDSTTFEFKLDYSKDLVKCDWITVNPNKVKERKRKWCKVGISQGGRSIRDACPHSCDFCFEEVTQEPTEAPSLSPAPSRLPTSTPSVSLFPSSSPSHNPTTSEPPTNIPSVIPSQLPSSQPTRPPSPQPSPFPSLTPIVDPSTQPSRFPSEGPTTSQSPSSLPSRIPSVSPSNSPSSQPSTLPSLAPSLIPSTYPSISPSRNPSISPSNNPSDNPSDQPSLSTSPSNLPSISPSRIPSGSPSISPSKEPSTPPTFFPTIHCYDKKWFKFKLDDVDEVKKCSWISDNPYKRAVRRERYCNRVGIKLACKKACDKCWCLDDPDYQFDTYNDRTVKCEWISFNPKQWQNRVDTYCGTRENPSEIANYCTRSCKYCTEEKSAVPSIAPSLSSIPSELPSMDPSDTPSEIPTVDPSDGPSLNPSVSVKPSSHKPSFSPTTSIKPSSAPTLSPSERPTVSMEPTTLPSFIPSFSIYPSVSPTDTPSSTPTTDAPTYHPTITCVDNSTFTFDLTNGNNRGCSWITGNSRNTPERIAAYCPTAHVKSNCKATCKFCKCENNGSFKFTVLGGDKKHCKWIDINPFKVEQRREEWCGTDRKPSEVANNCPEACGFCRKL